jgi:Tol biopolymer transport system component
LDGGTSSEIKVSEWAEVDAARWAVDGKGLFVSAYGAGSKALLYVDLAGHAEVLWQQPMRGPVYVWPIPSPDGRYLAFAAETTASNAWLIEGF